MLVGYAVDSPKAEHRHNNMDSADRMEILADDKLSEPKFIAITSYEAWVF